jgi:hypothetical protein
MKTKEIMLGGHYRNGSGSIREVVAEGPQFKLSRRQNDGDCVRFRLIATGKNGAGSLRLGSESNCTRNSFAVWAKERVA